MEKRYKIIALVIAVGLGIWFLIKADDLARSEGIIPPLILLAIGAGVVWVFLKYVLYGDASEGIGNGLLEDQPFSSFQRFEFIDIDLDVDDTRKSFVLTFTNITGRKMKVFFKWERFNPSKIYLSDSGRTIGEIIAPFRHGHIYFPPIKGTVEMVKYPEQKMVIHGWKENAFAAYQITQQKINDERKSK
jgi:hypothetical protein